MPTLIGPAAAFAQSGLINQLPRPAAMAVLAKAKLPRKRRRLRLLLWLNIGLDPFSRNKTLRPELDEDDGENEHQHIGDDRRNDPRQRRRQGADDTGAGHRPRERPDTADHHGYKTLNQKT